MQTNHLSLEKNTHPKMSIKFALIFCFISSLCFITSSPSFLAPVKFDFSKRKYLVSIYLKTPPQSTDLLIDLGASFTLLDCSSYTSSTYHTVPCGSSLCNSIGSACNTCYGSPGPACSGSNRTCAVPLGKSLSGEARVDSLYMPITDGRNPGRLSAVSEFVFTCTKRSSIKGIFKRASGLAGLGRSRLSLPVQVGNTATRNDTFALCLSGSPSAPGVAFFGTGGPYYFYPEIDLSQHLFYTPLLSADQVGISTRERYSSPANEYFIGLTDLRINGKTVFSNDGGSGKAMLSTITPYTVLHRSIFNDFIQTFVNESAALSLTVTKPVKPFKVCYNADDVSSTQTGPAVPTIDLVLNDGVIWRIFGSNSMVRIFRNNVDIWCLGFVDGGSKARASVVIGGHQLEDNLLQFDLGSQRLGFSSSVLVYNTMCANFNFTTNNNL